MNQINNQINKVIKRLANIKKLTKQIKDKNNEIIENILYEDIGYEGITDRTAILMSIDYDRNLSNNLVKSKKLDDISLNSLSLINSFLPVKSINYTSINKRANKIKNDHREVLKRQCVKLREIELIKQRKEKDIILDNISYDFYDCGTIENVKEKKIIDHYTKGDPCWTRDNPDGELIAYHYCIQLLPDNKYNVICETSLVGVKLFKLIDDNNIEEYNKTSSNIYEFFNQFN